MSEKEAFQQDNIALGSDDGSLDDKDAQEMSKLGKKQQLRRNFGFMSILGFSCVIMITWEGELTTFIYGLENGGPAGLIIGFLIVWLGYGTVVASLSELMSMWPTSSGQYHWCYTMAPPKWATFLSYICGWQSIIAWQAAVASAAYLSATMIQGLAVLNYPDYDFHLWHGTLIMYAIMIVATLFNTVLAKWLPMVESAVLMLHIAGFLVILITIVVLAPEKASAHEVFSVFLNEGNFPTQGVSFFAGLQGIVFAWLGADGAIHMAEEIKNASTILPWSLMGSVAINGVLGFSMLIAVLFCSGNINQALNSPTGYPFEAIFTYATRGTAGGTGLTSIVIAACIFADISCLAAASREMWAFSRDHGLPGSAVLKRVHKPTKLPLWALFTSILTTLLLALISIGSSIAFNAIISLTVASFISSYIIPLTLVLHRRVQAVRGVHSDLPWGPWRLGRWGILVNSIALCWCIVIVFWSFWPVEVNPSPKDMNWSILAYGATTILALAFWALDGRKRYKGPVRDAAGGEIEPVMGWDQIAVNPNST